MPGVVTERAGTTVVLRNDRTAQFTSAQLSRLLTGAHAASTAPAAEGELSLTLAWYGITEQQRAAAADRAGHVREVLTGYGSGHPGSAAAGEPRPEYAPGQPPGARYRAKARELGIGERTVKRWVAAYRQGGEPGLVDTRTVRGRGSAVDPLWDEAVRLVLADMSVTPPPTRNAVLRMVDARLDQIHSEGVIPRPSPAAAYRRLAELTKGTNAVTGLPSPGSAGNCMRLLR